MTATLDPRLQAALEALAARRPLLVALDFDGVLAPLVDDPDASRPLPASSAALARLVRAQEVHVALVSGRTMEDLRRLSSAPEGTILVASHGAQIDGVTTDLDAASAELLVRVTSELHEVSGRHDGTHVETKPSGAVLHTRRASRDVAERATQEALSGPSRRPGVRTLQGKDVVELSVVDADKGSAVAALRERLGVAAVLYAGDDVTDEHALATLDAQVGDVGVKVGDGETVAPHRVETPDDVATMLAAVADLLDAPA